MNRPTSNMNISRRQFFIGGAAFGALGAFSGCRFFASNGTSAAGAPKLKFGVVSDIHILRVGANEEMSAFGNNLTFKHTLEWFRSQDVDAVVIAGDMADKGLDTHLMAVAEAWYSVFPNDKYPDGRPVAIDTVVISHQTTEDGANKKFYAQIEEIARDRLAKTKLLTNRTRFYVNPTGKFVVGGPTGDSGLTGRKIIVDTYGGMAAHGGGAFSGKDPSKVDRSAAYYARYAAKNIVAAGYADRCQIQVAYAIGVDKPVSICVKTFGTNRNVTNEQLEKLLLSGKVFDFRPYALIADLGLTKPKGWSYRDTASYGHFGRAAFPWEKTDKVEALKDILG